MLFLIKTKCADFCFHKLHFKLVRVPNKGEYCLESIFIHLILLCLYRGLLDLILLLYHCYFMHEVTPSQKKKIEFAQGHTATNSANS